MAAIFSTNQNRQFYVATAADTVTAAANLGTIEAKYKDGDLYFLYKGVDGVTRSDRIPMKNLDYAKAISAADMVEPLKSLKVELDTNVNSGALEAGQDYVLRIEFTNFYGGGEDNVYFKDVAVHCTAAMVTTPANFWTAMKNELDLAFSREVGATATSNPYLTFNAQSTYLTITEKPQAWTLGTEQTEHVNFNVVPTTIYVNSEDANFNVVPTTIYVNSEDVIWGKVTDVTVAKSSAVVGTNAIGNGQKIADLEWFCMGERGDQYRYIGWPNNITTKYQVDSTKQYDVIEFHYAFTDTGVNSYRSEKDITIVADATSHTIINAVISAVNTAYGATLLTALT